MTSSEFLRSRPFGLIVSTLTAFLAACENQTVAPVVNEALDPGVLLFDDLFDGKLPKLLVCPVQETTSTTAVITPFGGSLSLGGHRIDVPFGALQLPVLMTLTEPASTFMEISVHVAGVDYFEFDLPVKLTISYERCNRSNIDKEPLQAWYIDEVTKELLVSFGGFDNKSAQTVQFRTGHLSGYALAD